MSRRPSAIKPQQLAIDITWQEVDILSLDIYNNNDNNNGNIDDNYILIIFVHVYL